MTVVTISIIGLVAVAMLFVGGIQKRWIFIGVGATAIFLVLYISIMGYAGNRITAWLNPDADPQNTGYQILQSQYAIGSGGLFGLGFGMGRQKHLYLPEEHNDYILRWSARNWALWVHWELSFCLCF